MLFTSQVPALLQSVLDGARASATAARKADAAKRLDFFHDGQLPHLLEQLERKFAQPEKLTPVFVNVVKKIVCQLALVYLDTPKREVEGSEADKELFALIVEQADLDAVMKTASRYVKLLKTCMIRPVWRNGRLDLDLLTPDLLDVEVGDSPRDVLKVMVTHYAENGRPEEVTYSLWTPETWKRLDWRGHEIEGGPNPYGVLPFLPLWDRTPTDSFWLPGGDDLVSMQEAINLKLTDLLHVIEAQGFGLGWIRGSEGGGTIDAGPGQMVELPEGGELGFAAPEAPIEEVVAAIDKLLKWAAISNGLSAASLSTDPTSESGVSKIVGNRELEEMRRDDVGLFRGYEKRLFGLIRTVWNHHSPTRKISESAALRVDFADPKPETSEKDQAATWELLLGMGLISPVDAAMERNPDLATREDALAHLLRVRDETAALTENRV